MEHSTSTNLAHLIHVLLLIKGEGKGEDVVLLMVGAAIVEHGLGGDTVPVGARRGLNKGGHPLSVQAFGLTEVDYVEYHSLQNLKLCVCVWGGEI